MQRWVYVEQHLLRTELLQNTENTRSRAAHEPYIYLIKSQPLTLDNRTKPNCGYGFILINRAVLLWWYQEPCHFTCKVIMHFSPSQTLAVVSHEPLSIVPNLPAESVQTVNKHTKTPGMTTEILPVAFQYICMQLNRCNKYLAAVDSTCVFVTLEGEQRVWSV